MGIPATPTYAQLTVEEINLVGDLADFDKDTLKQLAENLRRPVGRIPDPTAGQPGGAPAGATIPTPSFVFGAKSQKRIGVACNLVRFYNTIGRDLAPANIRWNEVIKNFEPQWAALVERKDNDAPDVPKITKNLTIIKWSEAFPEFLSRVIGVRTIPLSYVIRAEAAVPAACPARATDMPHSEEHGLVEADLIARASHTHALFRDNNQAVFQYLEEAV